ncbi:hypothetical protein LCGC14_0717650 [marine sediment metagenome]|uniref:Uncharacterized protein n=1 Tax=marine sediment metagenome TaxID=412755 RepID=A0A0F9QDA4_9ZZZZ
MAHDEYIKKLVKGNAKRWNDINFAAVNLKPGTTAPDFIPLFGSGGIYGWGFDGVNRTEELHGSDEILHGLIEGTDLDIHVHWMPTTAGAGQVLWQIEYTIVQGGQVASAPVIISAAEATNSQAWEGINTDIAIISGAGIKIESHFVMRVFRDPTESADTYGADAALFGVGIHYRIDDIGSRSQLVK